MNPQTFLLLFAGLLLILSLPDSTRAAPFVTQDKNDVIVDVSPFFKMLLHKDPTTGRTKVLDIDVLSGLVKVGYDRLQGRPNVDVSVFGFGSNRQRPPGSYGPTDNQPGLDGADVTYV